MNVKFDVFINGQKEHSETLSESEAVRRPTEETNLNSGYLADSDDHVVASVNNDYFTPTGHQYAGLIEIYGKLYTLDDGIIIGWNASLYVYTETGIKVLGLTGPAAETEPDKLYNTVSRPIVGRDIISVGVEGAYRG